MALTIIVKKGSRKSFHPHMNHAMGKYIHTRKDYMKTMKEMNLEPYDPSSVRKPKSKIYKPSQWARDMINSVRVDKDGKAHVGDKFRDELKKSDLGKSVPQQIREKREGGFYSG